MHIVRTKETISGFKRLSSKTYKWQSGRSLMKTALQAPVTKNKVNIYVSTHIPKHVKMHIYFLYNFYMCVHIYIYVKLKVPAI